LDLKKDAVINMLSFLVLKSTSFDLAEHWKFEKSCLENVRNIFEIQNQGQKVLTSTCLDLNIEIIALWFVKRNL